MKNTGWFSKTNEGSTINTVFSYEYIKSMGWFKIAFHTEKLGYDIYISVSYLSIHGFAFTFSPVNIKDEKIKELERSLKASKNNLHSMARILSEGTWKEGDNMMEAIETAQERKYLKEHAEDFLMIMNGNVPELAARELFEYFEVEVPKTDIEDRTARALHYLWKNWYLTCDMSHADKNNITLHRTFDELSENQKNKYREDARSLWYIAHNNETMHHL